MLTFCLSFCLLIPDVFFQNPWVFHNAGKNDKQVRPPAAVLPLLSIHIQCNKTHHKQSRSKIHTLRQANVLLFFVSLSFLSLYVFILSHMRPFVNRGPKDNKSLSSLEIGRKVYFFQRFLNVFGYILIGSNVFDGVFQEVIDRH